jgi:hypothetical protein
MAEIDDLPTPGELTDLLRQVIAANEPAVITAPDGHPVAALMPWELFDLVRRLLAKPRRTASDALTHGEERQARQLAAAIRARGSAPETGRALSETEIPSEPIRQQRWDMLLAKFRNIYPPDTTSGEIEADIAAAVAEARQERLTSGG